MSLIFSLAERVGILSEYHQIDGSHHACSAETAEALLAAMGLEAGDDTASQRGHDALDAKYWDGHLPHEIVVEAGCEAHLDLARWHLTLEDGSERHATPGAPGRLPPLPMGVHRMESERGPALVIAAPARAPLPRDLTGQDRVWGVMAPLYGLRSGRNRGIGDFEDLAAMAEGLAGHGAAFLGINPVHARGVAEDGASPYSPSSRTGFDTGHIALDCLPEARAPDAARLLAEAEAALAATRGAELIDYRAARAALLPALRAMFAAFEKSTSDRHAAFAAWRAARAEALARQSIFEALSLDHGPDWRAWPAALQDFGHAEVHAYKAANADEIAFHDWCQWIAGTQLANAQARARAGGMGLGIYLDIAVGVRPGGAETWANRSAFARGASLGAPPDLLNAKGQSWDLAPFSPLGLREQAYRPFRDMLAATMARAGMVRIDHIIGFVRSFWVPESGAPGGYVRFPTEVLLALTRIEAHRSGCVVVGEDLGTVPDGLRDALAEAGLYGCSILPFEREWDHFHPPAHYRPMTLASFGSHDLPSMEGWWQEDDIATRHALGHLDADQAGDARGARAEDRRRLCRLIRDQGLLPDCIDPENPPREMGAPLRDAVHIMLHRGAAGLVGIALDDIFGVVPQQNVPGTVTEAPNWRRTAPIAVEDVAKANEIARTGRALGEPPGDEREADEAT